MIKKLANLFKKHWKESKPKAMLILVWWMGMIGLIGTLIIIGIIALAQTPIAVPIVLAALVIPILVGWVLLRLADDGD